MYKITINDKPALSCKTWNAACRATSVLAGAPATLLSSAYTKNEGGYHHAREIWRGLYGRRTTIVIEKVTA